ncbi:MAG: hypothetical protein WCA27_30100 [Candidatus Sulfotelmatobacter sp.]
MTKPKPTWAEEIENRDDAEFALTVVRSILRKRASMGEIAPAVIVIDASPFRQAQLLAHRVVPNPEVSAHLDQLGPEFDENGVPLTPSATRCFDTFDQFEDWALKCGPRLFRAAVALPERHVPWSRRRVDDTRRQVRHAHGAHKNPPQI